MASLRVNNNIKGDREKGVLEKLIDIDKRIAVILAGDTLFGGVDTMNIFFGHQLLSMMESHFPRPSEFLPERWLVDKNDPLYFGQAHPFAYTPFGFGARSCIGRRIADLELETLLTKMIENFHVEWFAPHPKFKFSTLNYMAPPYNFIFNDIK
ncbi:unnamed protein product [Danaus chrysippus]|uniref:(African queen) hypothetical protein n=1 Tax=Danaus chrysippus TaxID=151541 RepID=A0A8J2QL63_9NEOP|nr:unnamed protein product [Danaus chrysippus]